MARPVDHPPTVSELIRRLFITLKPFERYYCPMCEQDIECLEGMGNLLEHLVVKHPYVRRADFRLITRKSAAKGERMMKAAA